MANQRTFVRSARRQAAWSSVSILTRAAASNSPTLGNQNVGAVALERSTIARIRGNAYVHMDAGAALDSINVALGLIIVPDEAFAAGIGSVPSPLIDSESSWIWHSYFPMGPAVTATDDGGDISRNMRIVIDSKAQRKIQTDEVLIFVWDAAVISGSPTFDGQAVVRMMFLET